MVLSRILGISLNLPLLAAEPLVELSRLCTEISQQQLPMWLVVWVYVEIGLTVLLFEYLESLPFSSNVLSVDASDRIRRWCSWLYNPATTRWTISSSA